MKLVQKLPEEIRRKVRALFFEKLLHWGEYPLADSIFRNIKALVDDYLEYFPETNVYYLSITRCSGTFANKWSEHSMSNKMMEKYCEETDRLTYLDVMALYGDNYASYQSDGLHPNQAGYDLFEQIIKENVEF